MDMDIGDEASEAMRIDLTCSVCQGIFNDPVLLPCTHSFCRECWERSWRLSKKCPICRELFTEDRAIANRDLKNACETFERQCEMKEPSKRSEFVCNLHHKPLELYCVKDEQPVCVECALMHSGHPLLSLRDGVRGCKVELQCKLDIFEKKVDLYKRMKHKLNKAVEYVKQQAGDADKQIKQEFEKLHSFLHAEENMRIEALLREEREKTAILEKRIQNTEKNLTRLKEHVDTLRKEMGNEDLPLLMNFQRIKREAEWTKDDPRVYHNDLLNMSKHIGALGFNVWKKMKDCVKYYPVMLDPNSASPWLCLSADLSSVKESPERLSVPDNPDRFDPCVFVLGAEGFESGKHKWDVIVGDNPKWIVGVCRESVIRKKKFTVSTKRGVYAVALSKGVYSALTPERPELPVSPRPQMIRVKLNMNEGQEEVSFWDAQTAKFLISFSLEKNEYDEMEKMYPIFGPGLQSTAMALVPGKIAVYTS